MRRTLLLGIGKNHLHDSYLSPLDYTGTTLGLAHISERAPRRGGKLTAFSRMAIDATRADNPKGNAEFWDVQADIAYGYHYNWHFLPSAASGTPCLRFALGALAGLQFGGTYNNRNGNNPAQGRLATELSLSAIGEWRFRLVGRPWLVRGQATAPLVGLMFTPAFGQSYYELFTLGHTDRNLRPTFPGNAPSFRLLFSLALPLRRHRFSIGYQADIRQSHLNGLKRHAWNNTLVIGYTRTLKFLD